MFFLFYSFGLSANVSLFKILIYLNYKQVVVKAGLTTTQEKHTTVFI